MGPELILLVVVLVVVFAWRGPKMLPRLGEALGRTVKGVRENLPGGMEDETDGTEGTDGSGTKSGS